mmetsp:Transcript_1029/g.1956  ORF Transcript_1029/g.1956 Transcript_1029/m.1956 type:complete len:99 (-) Transcript_1029:350-646(-)
MSFPSSSHGTPVDFSSFADKPPVSCLKAIEALQRCHEERTVAKFFGACNKVKKELDDCLTDEYKVKRAENFRLAKLSRQRFEEQLKSESTSDTPKPVN